MSFWSQLPRPFFCAAPMANITDVVFREMLVRCGKPDVLFTEFVSCDGLCSVGREALLPDLFFGEGQRPVVAQVFGAKPEMCYEAARQVRDLGFDGVDVNMGCPDRAVERQGAGAALMRTPSLAQEVLAAVAEGADPLPVSVKTRLGYGEVDIERWLPVLLECKPAAVTIHARTRKALYGGNADWEVLRRAVTLAKGTGTLVIGNGDVQSMEDAGAWVEEYGVDGVMVGRALMGRPWFFSGQVPSRLRRMEVMVEHARLFAEVLGEYKCFAVMKKHFAAYCRGFPGAKELRMALMQVDSPEGVEGALGTLGFV